MMNRQDTLSELLDLLLHTNAVIRLHNRATGDTLPLLPVLAISALAGMPEDEFARLSERTRQVLTDALSLAECQQSILTRSRL